MQHGSACCRNRGKAAKENKKISAAEEGTEIFTVESQMNIEDEYWEESVYEDVVFNIPRAQIVIEEIRVIKY